MPKEKAYYRPTTMSEALDLLQRPELRAVPLAGGSWLVPHLRGDIALPNSLSDQVGAVVDLAALSLRYIERRRGPDDEALHLGAMSTLSDLAESPDCEALAGGVLAATARRAAPINLRNTATLGGTLRRGSAMELVLALHALSAQVVVNDGAERLLSLPDLLDDPSAAVGHGLIVEVCLPWPAAVLRSGAARVARTPADEPIVAAVALVDRDTAQISIGGATVKPLLLELLRGETIDAKLDATLAGATLHADFRGSAEYRRRLAAVLARRALDQALAEA